MNTPTVSVITWDGSFRESYHTVDFARELDYPADRYDFTWCEYYSHAKAELRRRMQGPSNYRVLCLGEEGEWHAGRCMNRGVQETSGELLVIIDGDVVMAPDFMLHVSNTWSQNQGAAIYVRRFDQKKADYRPDFTLAGLERSCHLVNPTNFGGCLVIARSIFSRVGGYESHRIFGGPGWVNGELAVRLRNAGVPIIWHPTAKVFHPWHNGTAPPVDTPKQNRQAWVVRQRELRLDCVACESHVDNLLQGYPGPRTTASGGELGAGIKERLKKVPGMQRARRLWKRVLG